jgi:hypothetical protein
METAEWAGSDRRGWRLWLTVRAWDWVLEIPGAIFLIRGLELSQVQLNDKTKVTLPHVGYVENSEADLISHHRCAISSVAA